MDHIDDHLYGNVLLEGYEFAQGVALISLFSCLCTGVLGAVFTIYVITVATSVPRHND
jgi:hypothetical protein